MQHPPNPESDAQAPSGPSIRELVTQAQAGYSEARRRITVRRLVRLIDYRIGDGSAARTWVSLAVDAPTPLDTRPSPSAVGAPVALT